MRLSERGLTLTELAVVGVLASIVMLGIMGFYVSSQGVWMDASSQAITQREATTVVESITRWVHEASYAQASSTQLEVFDFNTNRTRVFWWNASGAGADSLIHEGPSVAGDRGPLATSICERFQCVANSSPGVVSVDFTLRSAQGERVSMSTQIVMVNRP